MLASFGHGRRVLVLAVAAAVVVTVAPTGVDAATPCAHTATASLKSSVLFASGGRLKRYVATVTDTATATSHSASVELTQLPLGAQPHLLAAAIGLRKTVGTMTATTTPTALATVNGDFFRSVTLQGKSVPVPLGPMVRDGVLVRGTSHLRPVIGLDTRTPAQPYGGTLGLRGRVRIGTTVSYPVLGLNWESVASGGATLFTEDWASARSAPRPVGAAEWVLDAAGTVIQIRTAAVNTTLLGSPVAAGTKVVAFPADLTTSLPAVAVGEHVAVSIRQRTPTGVTLRTAMGRGLPVVTAGVAAPLGCLGYPDSRSMRPRTVVGWTSTGLWRVVTVPGTGFDANGLRIGGFTTPDAGTIAAKLGLVDAFVVDGGGSTTLYTRDDAGVWSRRDLWRITSGTYERPVPNGLAFWVG